MSTRTYSFRHRVSYHRLLRLVWHVITRRRKAGGKDLQEAKERRTLKARHIMYRDIVYQFIDDSSK